jgi:hypothetical protein
MSTKSDEDEVCACCGIAAVDDVKLAESNGGCDLVKYCGDECQDNHREQHEDVCKQRKYELRDKKLFQQPDGIHLGDCPLCFLQLPLDQSKSSFYTCCCKVVCDGCVFADMISSRVGRCPFCRKPTVDSNEENDKRVMKRVKANDPVAMVQMGMRHRKERDHDRAIKYFTKAAELGDLHAHYLLGVIFYNGEGVEEDKEKAIRHWEKAAIGGHPDARHNLAYYEETNGNIDRAVKHLIIAANLGREESMKALWKFYSDGKITKEVLEATLRTHKAAIDATKSSERDAGGAFYGR